MDHDLHLVTADSINIGNTIPFYMFCNAEHM